MSVKIMNRWGHCSRYLTRATAMPGIPPALVVEATTRCNLRCTVCPRQMLDAAPCDMGLALFRSIVDQVKGAAEFIDLSFRGESLLHGDLFPMIAYAKKAGIHTSLQTNGMLLDEERCRGLVEAGLDILTVSIDAANEATYGKVRKGGDFRAVVENTRRMVRINREKGGGMTVIAQMIALEDNLGEEGEFKAFWRKEGAFAKCKPFSSRGGAVTGGVIPRRGNAVRCSRIWKSMYICADGKVVPCCNDFHCRAMLGDVREQTVAEVWNGAPMRRLRARHGAGEFEGLPVCGECEFLRTNFAKQVAAFVVDDLTVRRLLGVFGPAY